MSTLIAKSLLRRAEASRYDLHELIRQYAAEQLAARPQEQAATQARHALYYMTLFRDRDIRLRSAAQIEALAELTAEIDNFRIAREWALACGEFALIEQTMRAFASFYDMRGWLQDGLDYLGRAADALEAAAQKAPPGRAEQVALAHILAARSLLAFRQGWPELSRAMLDRSLAILRPLDEPRVLVEAVAFRAIVANILGDYGAALRWIDEGLAIATAIGDQWFVALCLTDHIVIGKALGNYDQASDKAYEELQVAVTAWRATGDPRFTAFGLNFLGLSATALGRYDEARAALEESVTLNSAVGDRWGLGSAYRHLGLVAQARNDHAEAQALFRKSLETHTELGARWDVARTLADLGRSAAALGDDTEAGRIWREAMRIAIQTGGTPVALDALVGLASLLARRAQPGDAERAFEWLVYALAHPGSTQETKSRARRLCESLGAQLIPPQIDAARARAGANTFEAVVDEVLKQAEFEQ